MSDPGSTTASQEFMFDLLERDAEGWARLSGLVAILGLTTRRQVEIELVPNSNEWAVIDGISITREKLECYWGVNGHREVFVFRRGESVPEWRFRGGEFSRPRPYLEGHA